MKWIGAIALAVCLGGCAAGATHSHSPTAPAKSAPGSTPTGAAAVLGTASEQRTRADVGQIVFPDDDVSLKVPHRQLYIERGDGSNVRRLVTSGDDDSAPALSPDGRRVVFDRQYPDHPDMPSRSFIVNVDGSGLVPLDPAGCGRLCVAEDVEGAAWSPDGRSIVVTRVYADAKGDPMRIGLWIVDVDSGRARELTKHTIASGLEDHQASWSPDGRFVVFDRSDATVGPGRSAIFTIRVNGTDAQRVTPWDLNAGDPDWSPDGKLIAFQSPAGPFEQDGEQNIYVIHPDRSGLVQLTAHLSSNDQGRQATFHASWSPDGSQIVFSHAPSTNGTGDLFVMRRDGSDLHSLGATALNENEPDWGPSPKEGD
jgi:Tol biopolymer transport system component